MQCRNIVENPDCATLSGDQYVLVLHLDVINWDVADIQMERLPVASIVERDEEAELRTSIK